MCRRLLALYNLPSWGRCELVLSLLQEPDVSYSLEDVVQAVKESPDKEFIKRLLNNECPCCLDIFPRGKVSQLATQRDFYSSLSCGLYCHTLRLQTVENMPAGTVTQNLPCKMRLAQ